MRTSTALAGIVALLVLAQGTPWDPVREADAGTGTPTFAIYAAPASLSNANNAAEPSIGVNWNTGNVMFQAYASTYRVAFNDATIPAAATWALATPPGSVANIDPILFTDRQLGRTWAGGLSGACSVLFYSDNDGASGSWSPPINTCSGAVDHESIASGPWHAPGAPLGASYPHAVYYCAQNGAIACSTSMDGGVTYTKFATVGGACSGLHGQIKVSADGTAYVPTHNCSGKVGGAISVNNGASWSSYTIPASAQPPRGFDPAVATTPNNTMYQAWSNGSTYRPMVARSTTHGATWDRYTDLSATVTPAIQTSTFHTMVAGDNGRAAVAFLGSATAGGSWWADTGWPGVWHLYVSYTYDAGLTWTTVKVTSDPVQRGCIWDGGGTHACRNMLDFMGASLTEDGRVVVGFADGCTGLCAGAGGTNSQSRSAWATIARQSTGKGLFAAYDGAGPNPPDAPVLSALPSNAKVDLSWPTPGNGGSAITGYDVYRGNVSGGATLLASLGVVNAYADTAVTNGVTYYYRVTAKNIAGTSALSNEASAKPDAINALPTACFSHSESGGTTSVNAGCSSDPDGAIVSYAWNWGDGSAAGSGASTSHAYAVAGTYTVALTVTDNRSGVATTSQSVTVGGAANQAPVACFGTSVSNRVVSVNAACTTDDGNVASYSWSWGDGSPASTGASATHAYAADGTYTITLTATDWLGASDTETASVSVVGDPDPATPTLSNGVGKTGATSSTPGSWQYYKIHVPSGKSQLKVDFYAPTGCPPLLECNPNIDLYVAQGAHPTTSAYACASTTLWNTETCTVASPATAWWYVGVHVKHSSMGAASGYEVKATYS